MEVAPANGPDPTVSGQARGHAKAEQGEAHKANGAFPARHWGEVRDLTKSSGQRLNPTERRQAEHDLDVRIRQAAAAAKRVGKFGTALQEMVEIATDRVDWRDKFRMTFDGATARRGELGPAEPALHPAWDLPARLAAHRGRSHRLRAGHLGLDLSG